MEEPSAEAMPGLALWHGTHRTSGAGGPSVAYAVAFLADKLEISSTITGTQNVRGQGLKEEAHGHGAALAHKERLAAPLARQRALGHLEQLALRVGLPPVAHALHAHPRAVAATQARKLALHVRPQRLDQLLRILQPSTSRSHPLGTLKPLCIPG